jgi:hypothetical protein
MKNFKQSILAISALVAVTTSLVYSQSITIQSTNEMKGYQIAQIAKITPRADSTIYNLVGGGRYAAVTLGQKWTFGGSVAISEVKAISTNTKFSVQNNVLSVNAETPSQFKLSLLNGSIVAQNSKSELEWNIQLKPQQIYVLQVQSQSSNQSYLIQSSVQGQ